jgi:hypothetical protein
MRKRNWRQYNKALVQRGSLTFLLDPKIIKNLSPKRHKRKGRPLEFSDELIQMLIMIKVHYRLTYRALEGFTRYLLEQIKKVFKVPTYSLTCKRAKNLCLKMPSFSNSRCTTLIVDASGIKVQGEGEWKVKVHGKGRPRKWIKIHIAIDAKTQEIVGEVLTEAKVADGKVLPALLDQISNKVDTVIGDGAYDGCDVRKTIKSKKAKALIPPPKNAKYRRIDDERDRATLDIRAFGGDKIAKSIWGKISGYSQRALVETAFSRYKKIFGDRFFSRTVERQILENRLKCMLLNKMRQAIA